MFQKIKILINRNTIIAFIAIAIGLIIIAVVQILNSVTKQKDSSSEENFTTTSSNTYTEEISQITGIKTNKTETEENKTLINKFVELCNNKKIEEAYNCLSSNCKKEVFDNNINEFNNNYYNKIFDKKRLSKIDLWIKKSNTFMYKIILTNDILSSGSYDNSAIEDYYTVITENNEKKLSINKYVNTYSINKSKTLSKISININYKKVYYSYEIYTLEITNNTENTILIDSQKNIDTLYIQDIDKNKYGAYLSEAEMYEGNLEVSSGQTKTINIKFDKMYSTTKNIEKMKFSNIVLNKNDYTNTTEIEIEM